MTEEKFKCQWPSGCKAESMSLLLNSDESEKLFLCSIHRKIAILNLEQSDRLFLGTIKKEVALQNNLRPASNQKSPPPKPKPPVDWEKEAARKAAAQDVAPEDMTKQLLDRIGVAPKPRMHQ